MTYADIINKFAAFIFIFLIIFNFIYAEEKTEFEKNAQNLQSKNIDIPLGILSAEDPNDTFFTVPVTAMEVVADYSKIYELTGGESPLLKPRTGFFITAMGLASGFLLKKGAQPKPEVVSAVGNFLKTFKALNSRTAQRAEFLSILEKGYEILKTKGFEGGWAKMVGYFRKVDLEKVPTAYRGFFQRMISDVSKGPLRNTSTFEKFLKNVRGVQSSLHERVGTMKDMGLRYLTWKYGEAAVGKALGKAAKTYGTQQAARTMLSNRVGQAASRAARRAAIRGAIGKAISKVSMYLMIAGMVSDIGLSVVYNRINRVAEETAIPPLILAKGLPGKWVEWKQGLYGLIRKRRGKKEVFVYDHKKFIQYNEPQNKTEISANFEIDLKLKNNINASETIKKESEWWGLSLLEGLSSFGLGISEAYKPSKVGLDESKAVISCRAFLFETNYEKVNNEYKLKEYKFIDELYVSLDSCKVAAEEGGFKEIILKMNGKLEPLKFPNKYMIVFAVQVHPALYASLSKSYNFLSSICSINKFEYLDLLPLVPRASTEQVDNAIKELQKITAKDKKIQQELKNLKNLKNYLDSVQKPIGSFKGSLRDIGYKCRKGEVVEDLCRGISVDCIEKDMPKILPTILRYGFVSKESFTFTGEDWKKIYGKEYAVEAGPAVVVKLGTETIDFINENLFKDVPNEKQKIENYVKLIRIKDSNGNVVVRRGEIELFDVNYPACDENGDVYYVMNYLMLIPKLQPDQNYTMELVLTNRTIKGEISTFNLDPYLQSVAETRRFLENLKNEKVLEDAKTLCLKRVELEKRTKKS